MVFQVGQGLVWFAKLVFHLLAVVNLSNPFEDNLVVGLNSTADDKDVFQFTLNYDLALMDHPIVPDDVYVALVEDFKRRALRNDDGVGQGS